MRYSFLHLTLILSMLAACGGDNSRNRTPAAPALMTGTFAPYPITGLRFETATQSGITDADGAFQYFPGEEISFYLGEQMLATTAAAPSLSLFDLYGARPKRHS